MPEALATQAHATQAHAPERILQRLEWQVIRRLDGQLQGDYRSLFYGYGVDFADLREYQPEDDIRYIDWNVTARMDTPYVRQYMEDREITAWFLLDLSPSMDFGTAQAEKRAVLIDLVGTLARLLTRHGNRVGAILYSGQARSAENHRVERVIPAKGGRNHVLWLINDLLKQPRPRTPGFTDLKWMLEGGLYSIKKRSLVFVISDFISAPGWERTLNLLNRRHEVMAVRLWDPTRGRAARRGAGVDGGRRDRRAALRGHARSPVPGRIRDAGAGPGGGAQHGVPPRRGRAVGAFDRRGPGAGDHALRRSPPADASGRARLGRGRHGRHGRAGRGVAVKR